MMRDLGLVIRIIVCVCRKSECRWSWTHGITGELNYCVWSTQIRRQGTTWVPLLLVSLSVLVRCFVLWAWLKYSGFQLIARTVTNRLVLQFHVGIPHTTSSSTHPMCFLFLLSYFEFGFQNHPWYPIYVGRNCVVTSLEPEFQFPALNQKIKLCNLANLI